MEGLRHLCSGARHRAPPTPHPPLCRESEASADMGAGGKGGSGGEGGSGCRQGALLSLRCLSEGRGRGTQLCLTGSELEAETLHRGGRKDLRD